MQKSKIPAKTPAKKPTREPAKAVVKSAPAVTIFQVVRSAADKLLLDPLATELALMGSKASLYGQLESLVKPQSLTRKPSLWGVLPADFAQRTGVPVQALADAVAANPGRDVYLVNPNPAEEAIFPNPLSRLFVESPAAAAVVEDLLAAATGTRLDANALCASAGFSMAPMMVATPGFWGSYWAFTKRAVLVAERSMKDSEKNIDKKWLHAVAKNSTVLAGDSPATFFLGGLVAPFLATEEGQQFKALKVAIPAKEAGLNAHLKSLRQLKDAAVKAKSAWLASCWLNYRNLYVYQVNGKDWSKSHLGAITPKTAQFF